MKNSIIVVFIIVSLSFISELLLALLFSLNSYSKLSDNFVFALFAITLLFVSYLIGGAFKAKPLIFVATIAFVLSLVPMSFLNVLGWHISLSKLEVALFMSMIVVVVSFIVQSMVKYRYNKLINKD